MDVSDPCHLKFIFSPAYWSIWTSLSARAFPVDSCKNIEIEAEIGETRYRMRLHVYTSWYCGGVVQRGPSVREGAHALARREGVPA